MLSSSFHPGTVSPKRSDAAILRLRSLAALSPEGCGLLRAVLGQRMRQIPSRADIVREGDPPRVVRVFHEGWACRYKQLPDGRRQIVAFFIPGDLCDSGVFLLDRMDHSIAAITPVKLGEILPADFVHLAREAPDLAEALTISELVTVAIQREWTLGLGQRSALERVAHLMCELYVRMDAVGLVEGGAFSFPLTQVDIGSATGLTPVHVNRTLQELRRCGLIELGRRRLKLLDPLALMAAAMFDPGYLHLRDRPPGPSASAP
ncbi:Crp/Fnr family transcriptional regulator [Novosphingobium jiangmenense]|uniref:Crp/Fnr family transcriptional regulator n=1 Tax=Novosphingobium jiangmenense TaxID=2791981 RepID=UPI001FE700EE|nr:Crp/Fnr family transcriptional regulator [Novosphingobium jiangmenense]